MHQQDQNIEHPDTPKILGEPLISVSSEPSGSSLPSLMGNISPLGRLTPDIADDRSRLLGNDNVQGHYGSVESSAASARKSRLYLVSFGNYGTI